MQQREVTVSSREIRPFTIDCRRVLGDSEDVDSAVWTVSTGLTKESQSETTQRATALVSIGSGLNGATVYVRGLVTTTTGQVVEGLFIVEVKDGPTIS